MGGHSKITYGFVTILFDTLIWRLGFNKTTDGFFIFMLGFDIIAGFLYKFITGLDSF